MVSAAAVVLASALVYLLAKRTRKVSGFIDISETKRRIDQENHVKVEELLRTNKRITSHEEILKELNRYNSLD